MHWRTVVRRIFIAAAILAIPLMAWKIAQNPFARGHWASIIEYDRGAPPGTEVRNIDQLPEINFALLKTYRFFEGKGVPPEELKALDGQMVQLKGYVLQPPRGDEVRDFRMVGDLLSCCFGGKPLVNAVVDCDLEEGKKFPYKIAAHRIVGEFKMREERDEDDEVIRIFHMRVYEVQRLKK
ncbi:MAG: hypothetical protein V2A58_05910 [Planctomycetota bacterium]